MCVTCVRCVACVRCERKEGYIHLPSQFPIPVHPIRGPSHHIRVVSLSFFSFIFSLLVPNFGCVLGEWSGGDGRCVFVLTKKRVNVMCVCVCEVETERTKRRETNRPAGNQGQKEGIKQTGKQQINFLRPFFISFHFPSFRPSSFENR